MSAVAKRERGEQPAAEVRPVMAAVPGVFEDTSNTEALVATDEICLRIVNGGGGTLTLKGSSIQFENTSGGAPAPTVAIIPALLLMGVGH